MTKKRILNLVLILLIILIQASCKRNANQSKAPPSGDPPCLVWEKMVEKLTPSEKEDLLREGILTRTLGGYLLSESLVEDCKIRIEMAAYFRDVIGGEDNQNDRQFAADHSREIVEVLRRIWPSLNSPSGSMVWDSDGIADEKYNLLAESALKESDVGPLLGEILKKERVDGEMSYILMSRPIPQVKIALLYKLKEAEKQRDIPQQIYILAVLQSLDEQQALAKLRVLYTNKQLSKYERELIPKLISKIEGGEKPMFSDIEDLEYSNDRWQ